MRGTPAGYCRDLISSYIYSHPINCYLKFELKYCPNKSTMNSCSIYIIGWGDVISAPPVLMATVVLPDLPHRAWREVEWLWILSAPSLSSERRHDRGSPDCPPDCSRDESWDPCWETELKKTHLRSIKSAWGTSVKSISISTWHGRLQSTFRVSWKEKGVNRVDLNKVGWILPASLSIDPSLCCIKPKNINHLQLTIQVQKL